MPKLGTYGSVRGASSNGCLYRNNDIHGPAGLEACRDSAETLSLSDA